MRVLFLGNNRVGWRVAQALERAGDVVVGAVLNAPGRRRYEDEILAALRLSSDQVIDGSRLAEPAVRKRLAALRPDMGVSAFFGHLLRRPVLDLMPRGCVNVHPALLPYNRGAYPNVWSIIDRTPAGATIHFIDEGVDTGDVVAQREVAVRPIDTGATLYERLEEACIDLFEQTWPAIRCGESPRTPQPRQAGSFHRLRDVESVDRIDLDAACRTGDLIDLLRARTFGSYPSAYFVDGGRKVYVRVQLTYEGEE